MDNQEKTYQEFDLNKLSKSAELKRYFEMVQLRMDEVSRSIIAGYGLPSHLNQIKTIIADELEFNAEASSRNKIAYVSINASVLMILRTLFDHIFSNDSVLPQLSQDKEKQNINYQAPFILDPHHPFERSQVSISISEDRYKASGILSDLCINFIILHEFGHILGGHPEALQHYCLGTRLLELFKKTERKQANANLRQYWEFQADNIAASLLTQYVGDTIQNAASHQTWILKATGLKADQSQEIAIHVAAMTLASLHTLFLYMDNCTFKVNKSSYHPPAQARMMYIKDVFCDEMSMRWSISPHKIVEVYIDIYLEPFMSSLEEMGLTVIKGFTDANLDINEQIARDLKYANERYRNHCREWSWLPVDEWGNPQS